MNSMVEFPNISAITHVKHDGLSSLLSAVLVLLGIDPRSGNSRDFGRLGLVPFHKLQGIVSRYTGWSIEPCALIV